MSQRIEIRCQHCTKLLFVKIVPERKGVPEYGGVEIKCSNCEAINTFGIKPKEQPFGERMTYSKKSA